MQFIVIPTRAASILRDALVHELGRPVGQAEQQSANAHNTPRIEQLRAPSARSKRSLPHWMKSAGTSRHTPPGANAGAHAAR